VDQFLAMPPNESTLKGATVLIAEDEMTIADDIAEIIACVGGGVLGPVATVSCALELIERERPDLATLDTNLRRESAVPIASRLLDMEVPLIVVTGYFRETLPEQFRAAPYVAKPYEPQVLAATLAEFWLKSVRQRLSGPPFSLALRFTADSRPRSVAIS
jgi:two-component SAPR family response regulator